MSYYQGRALERDGSRGQPRGGMIRRLSMILGALMFVVVLAHVPWATLRIRVTAVRDIRVDGLHYLDAGDVAEIAGIKRGQDLFTLDCAKARQSLLLHSRIERAEVSREWPRGVRIRVVERTPSLLVRHGQPWEMDSNGILLAPLAPGAVADVPLLAGASFERMADGAEVHTPEVLRGLAWTKALGVSELQLGGQVSEIDVSDPGTTSLLMMDGTRVLSSAWPPGTRTLSALRVVLADLKRRHVAAREVDLRFRNQVIVRPAEPAGTEPLGSTEGSPDPFETSLHASALSSPASLAESHRSN